MAGLRLQQISGVEYFFIATPTKAAGMTGANADPHTRLDGQIDLILVRHAESVNNVLADQIRRTYGPDVAESTLVALEARMQLPDCGLSDRGHRQLEQLQRYDWRDYFLKEGAFPRCKVFSSPMQRCLLTARAVGASLRSSMDEPVVVRADLFEEGGCYQHQDDGTPIGLPGTAWQDICAQFPDFVCPQATRRGWYDRAHIETADEFHARAFDIVGWIWAMQQDMLRSGHGALVLVMHGNIMSAIMSALFSGAAHRALYKHCNTGHTHIELVSHGNKNLTVCQSVNKVTHLLHERDLIGGDHSVDDRWIQQFRERD